VSGELFLYLSSFLSADVESHIRESVKQVSLIYSLVKREKRKKKGEGSRKSDRKKKSKEEEHKKHASNESQERQPQQPEEQNEKGCRFFTNNAHDDHHH
jgi:hypothetical protein